MTTKHTPGPRKWVDHGGYFSLEGPTGEMVCDDGSAGGEYSRAVEPDGPNGRLLAAAPDLLAALRVLVGEMEIEGYDTGGMSHAYAALAKAVGR